MTALVHAYQQMISSVPLRAPIGVRAFRFEKINQKGIVTFCLLGLIGLGALQYVGALYGIFFSGLQLQVQNQEIARLTETTNELELNIQRAGAGLVTDHKDILDAMEKISQVRYITEENVAVSYMPAHQ